MGLEGYTGPTSGRITLDADGTPGWERFYDKLLTSDELNATTEFRALSPNEQVREYRRMKWNEAVFRAESEEGKKFIQEQHAEIERLRARLVRYAPDGYDLPAPAAYLIRYAGEHGWQTDRVWNDTEDGLVSVEIGVTSAGRMYRLRWFCDPGGTGRMARSGLARLPGRDWHDAPSLKKIKEDIAAHPAH